MLIDTHCHPQYKPLNKDVSGVLARAKDAGVGKMIVVGYDLPSSKQAVELSEKYDNLWAAVGLHPQDASFLTPNMLVEFTTLAAHNRVVAIGETGLDYYRLKTPKDVQKKVLREHIKIAHDLKKPLVLHNRESDDDCLAILQEENVKDAVFHCFASDVSFARKVWAAGYMTSFTGIVTYPSARNLHEVVKECPLEYLMIETDCPYLSPQSKRGSTNEPSYLPEIAKEVARLKGLEYAKIEQASTENAQEFFGV